MPLSTEEQLEFLKFTGVDPESAENLDSAKAAFKKSHVHVNEIAQRDDLIGPLFGKKIGEIETKFKQSLRGLVDFEEGELKDKKFQEIIDLSTQKLEDKIKDLKESASSSD